MEENDSGLKKHGLSSHAGPNEGANRADEPTTYTRELVHEMLAREMREAGIEAEPQDIGTSSYEKGPYSSNMFPIGSLGMTSRGIILVRDRNFDFVQVLQRG
jgi:hypothetical protein